MTLACMHGDGGCARLLIQRGAQVDSTDDAGDTAAMWAAGSANLECLEILMAAGAYLSLKNIHGRTARWRVVNGWSRDRLDAGRAACLLTLLRTGAEPFEDGGDLAALKTLAKDRGLLDLQAILSSWSEAKELAAAASLPAASLSGASIRI